MNLKMTAAAKEYRAVTLPENVSLPCVAQLLLETWEAEPPRGSKSHKIISECRGRPRRLRQPTGH
jgi:hypothetical protein